MCEVTNLMATGGT